MLALLLLLYTSATAAANVTIVVGAASGGVDGEAPPAWFLAARAEDQSERARERAEDRSERARERAEDRATMSAMQETLTEVAETVVTRTAAARVDQCAPSIALLVMAEFPGGIYKHASAVPMFGAGGTSSSYLLTSAHVFPADATGKMLADYAGARHTCALAANFFHDPSPLDLAIVHCASGIAVPPSNLSATAYRPHLSVAMLGFSEGSHENLGLCNTEFSINERAISIAPHVRFTRLASSFQTPSSNSPTGSTAPQDGLTMLTSAPPAALETAVGYLDGSPEQGMSGGAVVDLRCGLLGILKRKSLLGVGGELVRLTQPVVGRVLEAIAQFEGKGRAPVKQ